MCLLKGAFQQIIECEHVTTLYQGENTAQQERGMEAHIRVGEMLIRLRRKSHTYI